MKPMKASDYDPAKLRFPVWASPKLDGLRCVVKGGIPLSNTLKPFPSKHVISQLGFGIFEGFDGELIVGDAFAPNVFSNTTSHVMARDKIFDFIYFVFDLHNQPDTAYCDRYKDLCGRVMEARKKCPYRIVVLEQTEIQDMDALLRYETHYIECGYEGIMIRDKYGCYKYGRSTVNEGLLLKVKRFADSEAVIIGFEEQMQNTNEKVTNELGHGKRSSHKAGLIGKGTLGALHVRDLKTGMEFHVGTGLSAELRMNIWVKPKEYIGKMITYKYFPVGVKDLPRHPVFKGFRHPEDMS